MKKVTTKEINRVTKLIAKNLDKAPIFFDTQKGSEGTFFQARVGATSILMGANDEMVYLGCVRDLEAEQLHRADGRRVVIERWGHFSHDGEVISTKKESVPTMADLALGTRPLTVGTPAPLRKTLKECVAFLNTTLNQK